MIASLASCVKAGRFDNDGGGVDGVGVHKATAAALELQVLGKATEEK
jgi:hypothetical protein